MSSSLSINSYRFTGKCVKVVVNAQLFTLVSRTLPISVVFFLRTCFGQDLAGSAQTSTEHPILDSGNQESHESSTTIVIGGAAAGMILFGLVTAVVCMLYTGSTAPHENDTNHLDDVFGDLEEDNILGDCISTESRYRNETTPKSTKAPVRARHNSWQEEVKEIRDDITDKQRADGIDISSSSDEEPALIPVGARRVYVT